MDHAAATDWEALLALFPPGEIELESIHGSTHYLSRAVWHKVISGTERLRFEVALRQGKIAWPGIGSESGSHQPSILL